MPVDDARERFCSIDCRKHDWTDWALYELLNLYDTAASKQDENITDDLSDINKNNFHNDGSRMEKPVLDFVIKTVKEILVCLIKFV